MKILAIDDNKDNLTTLQAILQEVLPACTLVTALTGPRGLELAVAEDPDVILLDIIMPGMDGYEVCRQVKGDARLRLIPVIFLTAAGTDRASRIQALDCGAEGFIAKPLDGLVLVAEVRAMAKIKASALLQLDEARRLSELVVERTHALRLSERSLLNTLEDVRAENEARKEAQAASQSAHALSSTIIDSIPGCFYMLDENGCYVRWNTYQRDVIVGKPDDQIAGMNALDTIHPEDRAAIQAKIASVLQNGTVESVEGRVLLHGGPDFIWLLMTGRGIVIAGRPFLVGTGIDITERKRLEAYREMGREILQILNDPGELPAAVQRIIPALKKWTECDAVGLRLQEGLDFPYVAQDGFSKEFLLTENTLLARGANDDVCRDKGGQVCLECTCGLVISGKTEPTHPLCTKGGSFWTNDSLPLLDLAPGQDPRLHPRNTCIHHGYASVALVPIRAKDRIVGLIQLNDRRKDRFTRATVELLETIAAHIGEALMRKQVEAEHARLQVQFVQAQKMESVGRLAGGVAHDFNNLLMGMMGYVEMCRDVIDANHPGRAWLDEIMVSAQKSADITRQLLAFARKQVVEPRRLHLNDAVAGMTKLLHRLIGEDITLAWVPGPNMGPILIDPSQVDQILANLCVNARDAIGGTGRITLASGRRTIDAAYCATHPEAGPGEYMYLSVTDDGCGMSAETLGHIFEPFFTTKSLGHGTGLGLATVYGIVTQNRGFIDVASVPGQGATFTIHLPEAADEAVAVTSASAVAMPRGQGQTILVVEDDRSVMVPLCLTLKALGYNVLAAGNPREALELADQQPCAIQLVLTDVVMPGASGLQLAEQLHSTRPDLKIVFMSGYTADSPALRDVLARGGNMIAKPFTRESLARKLHAVLDGDG